MGGCAKDGQRLEWRSESNDSRVIAIGGLVIDGSGVAFNSDADIFKLSNDGQMVKGPSSVCKFVFTRASTMHMDEKIVVGDMAKKKAAVLSATIRSRGT
jgi:hypothetical protein